MSTPRTPRIRVANVEESKSTPKDYKKIPVRHINEKTYEENKRKEAAEGLLSLRTPRKGGYILSRRTRSRSNSRRTRSRRRVSRVKGTKNMKKEEWMKN